MFRISSIIAGSALLSAGIASAQTIVQSHYGPAQGQNLGYAISAAGDIDGDQVPDYVATDPRHNGSTLPILYAYSGATGATLYTVNFPTAMVSFGSSVEAGADVTGDGWPDIMLTGFNTMSPAPGLPSAPNGGAYIFSGPTGAFVRARLPPPGYTNFGINPRYLGDLDHDGVTEYGIGAIGSGNLRAFLVFSGANDALLYIVSGQQPDDAFGTDLEAIGDVDGDGFGELVIGAPAASLNGLTYNGVLRVFSGANGIVIKSLAGTIPTQGLGGQFASLGDAGLNSSPDLAIQDFWTDSVRVVDLLTEQEVAPPSVSVVPGWGYGHQLAALGDFDGDDWNDYAVTEWLNGFPIANEVFAVSARTATPLFRFDDPHSTAQPPVIYSNYPNRLEVLGDIDGDGRDEWLFGHDMFKDPLTGNRGLVEVVSLTPLVGKPSVLGPATNTKLALDINGGFEFAGANYYVLASFTGTTGIPVWGVNLPLTFDPLTELSINFANTPFFSKTFGVLSSTGRASPSFDASLLPPAADGLTFHFAAFVLTSSGKATATNAVSVPIDLL